MLSYFFFAMVYVDWGVEQVFGLCKFIKHDIIFVGIYEFLQERWDAKVSVKLFDWKRILWRWGENHLSVFCSYCSHSKNVYTRFFSRKSCLHSTLPFWKFERDIFSNRIVSNFSCSSKYLHSPFWLNKPVLVVRLLAVY